MRDTIKKTILNLDDLVVAIEQVIRDGADEDEFFDGRLYLRVDELLTIRHRIKDFMAQKFQVAFMRADGDGDLLAQLRLLYNELTEVRPDASLVSEPVRDDNDK